MKDLERAKEEKKARGEVETERPGYLLWIGGIYQQTVIDTYSKVSFVKLYYRKNALVAAEMFNDKGAPWLE